MMKQWSINSNLDCHDTLVQQLSVVEANHILNAEIAGIDITTVGVQTLTKMAIRIEANERIVNKDNRA